MLLIYILCLLYNVRFFFASSHLSLHARIASYHVDGDKYTSFIQLVQGQLKKAIFLFIKQTPIIDSFFEESYIDCLNCLL